MGIPGFSATHSLYTATSHYRTTGATTAREAVLPAGTATPLEALSPHSGDTGRWIHVAGGERPRYVPEYGPSLQANLTGTVLPMSVPGHVSAPGASSQCSDCHNNCQYTAVGQWANALGGCAGLGEIPLVGAALAAACVGTAALAIYFVERSCESSCNNVGSPCCPVPCGPEPFCCFEGESCLDSGQGLCCPPGTQPCIGAQESCYDQRTEKCMSSGLGCPTALVCGDKCCNPFEACVGGTCTSCTPELGGIPCGSACCDASTQQCINNACCPNAQACGGTCCPDGTVCNASGQCVVPQSCSPGEHLCVNATTRAQTCCPGDAACCDDGSCCGGSATPGRPTSACCGIPSICCPPPG